MIKKEQAVQSKMAKKPKPLVSQSKDVLRKTVHPSGTRTSKNIDSKPLFRTENNGESFSSRQLSETAETEDPITSDGLQNKIPMTESLKKMPVKNGSRIPVKEEMKAVTKDSMICPSDYGLVLQKLRAAESQFEESLSKIQILERSYAETVIEVETLKKENLLLLQKNTKLIEENKKTLRQKVTAFNDEGMCAIKNREKITELQHNVGKLEGALREKDREISQLKAQLSSTKQKNCQHRSLAPESSLFFQSMGSEMEFIENSSICRLIEDCQKSSSQHVIQKSDNSQQSTHYPKLGECIQIAKDQFMKSVKQIEEIYKKLFASQVSLLREQRSEISELENEISRLIDRERSSETQELNTSLTDQKLLLVRTQATLDLSSMEKDRIIANLKQDLLEGEMELSRLKSDLEISKVVSHCTDDNELFELNMTQISQSRAIQNLKKDLLKEQQLVSQLKIDQVKKNQLIKAFSAKRNLARVMK